jgi:hypothetical protein
MREPQRRDPRAAAFPSCATPARRWARHLDLMNKRYLLLILVVGRPRSSLPGAGQEAWLWSSRL